jgi:outer membrane translocation and assembly module TamA
VRVHDLGEPLLRLRHHEVAERDDAVEDPLRVDDVQVIGELRIRLQGALEGALFADVGNLWDDPKQVRLQDERVNVGFGIRFVTPIGPAALDIGFNVTPDERLNEPIVAPHFTIGLF